eukprot:gene2056-3037_t
MSPSFQYSPICLNLTHLPQPHPSASPASDYMVTPEAISAHHARHCSTLLKNAVVVDGFSGSGGNAIAFAQVCRLVIAIDIDPIKIQCARHNATIYGVQDKIEWVCGDFLSLIPRLQVWAGLVAADVVFLSPPWGGPDYLKFARFDVRRMGPFDGAEMFRSVWEHVTRNIIYFLPRNTHRDQVARLAPPGSVVEWEYNWINDRAKTVTAYFGAMVDYQRAVNTPVPALLQLQPAKEVPSRVVEVVAPGWAEVAMVAMPVNK